MHKQTWAKVNASVDEGVKDLVEALSEFPPLQTVESCEDVGKGTAWVCFTYGHFRDDVGDELATFVLKFLGPRLVEELGDGIHISVYLDSAGLHFGELSVRSGWMKDTVRTLRTIGIYKGEGSESK